MTTESQHSDNRRPAQSTTESQHSDNSAQRKDVLNTFMPRVVDVVVQVYHSMSSRLISLCNLLSSANQPFRVLLAGALSAQQRLELLNFNFTLIVCSFDQYCLALVSETVQLFDR